MNNVLIFNPYAQWTFHFMYEWPIYENLKSRGYNPIYIGCGAEFKECDLHWKATSDRPINACEICIKTNQSIKNKTQLNYNSLNEFTNEVEKLEIEKIIEELTINNIKDYKFGGFNIYNIAMSSVYTHFRINKIDLSNDEIFAVIKSYFKSALLTIISFSRIIQRYRPKAIFLFNGRMAITRVVLELAKLNGIRVVSHERGFTKGSLQLVENDHCLNLKHYEEINRICEVNPLRKNEIEDVFYWLKDKIEGRNTNWRVFTSSKIEKFKTTDFNKKKKWVLYTSSMDEVVSDEAYTSIFEDQVNWINETIKFCKKWQNKLDLEIRVHPNSSSSVSNGNNFEEKLYFENLKKEFSDTNIIIHSSDSNVSSYDLLNNSDFVLCYASTIGLEARLMGREVFIAAKSPVYYCNGMIHAQNIENYHEILNDKLLSAKVDYTNCILAARYVHTIIYKYNINLPFIEQTSTSNNKLNINSIQSFKFGNYNELDYLVDVILGNNCINNKIAPKNNVSINLEALLIKEIYDKVNYINLSVIITTYNYASYLESCIDSVFRDDYDDMELIIVDDGSTDNTVEIVAKIIEKYKYKRINYIFQNNSGQPAISRNNGIKQAKGRYILPLDADDEIAENYINSAMKIFYNRPEVNVLFADSIHHYREKSVRHKPGEFSNGAIAIANRIVIASFYSKSLWEKVGGYRENVKGFEDWDFWLNISLNGAIPAYYDGVGLLYNARKIGLYESVKNNHDKLYAKIILNNTEAYKYDINKITWAIQENIVSK